MTPRETDELNLRVNKPLIAWSVEKPGVMLVSDRALWFALATGVAAVASASVLGIAIARMS